MTWYQTSDRISGPDVYFSSAYGRAAEVAEEGKWAYLELRGGAVACPMLLRDLPSGNRDAISPYGYSGIWRDTNIDVPPEEVWRELLSEMRQLGIVSFFVRESPLLPQLRRPESAKVVTDDHPTFSVQTKDGESMWDLMEGRSRTAIRKAWKLGAKTTFAPVSPTDLADGSNFRSLYDATMQRVGSTEYYHFDRKYYMTLSGELGQDLYLGQVELDGQVECAALFMRSGELLHYHLSGSSLAGSRSGCTNLLLWTAMEWANGAGITRLHLGGGLQRGDGLERFKKSFGGTRLGFGAYGVIVDERGYSKEVESRERELLVPPGSIKGPGFFPAYRRSAR